MMKTVLKLVLFVLIASFLGGMPRALAAQNTISGGFQDFNTLSDKDDEQTFAGSWNFSLYGRQSQDDLNQTTLDLISANVNLNYELADWAKLEFDPSLKGMAGHAQTQTEFDVNQSGFFIRKAVADFTALKIADLEFGALAENEWHSELLMDARSFPGVRLTLSGLPTSELNYEGFKNQRKTSGFISAFAESSVPTSSSLSTDTKQFEPTPSFTTGGLAAGIKGHGMYLSSRADYFEFQNLPISVANASGLLGNSVNSADSSDYTFKYQYQGLEAQLDLGLTITNHWQLHSFMNYQQNTAAPSALNTAYKLGLESTFLFSRSLSLTPSYSYFQIYPDSAVAAYNLSYLGTNRAGYEGRVAAKINNRFNIQIGGGETSQIYENPTLPAHQHYYYLGLETLDAIF